MSYPHLERRFDVVKDKLRAFVLEAARCLARPTWRCGQRDLLVTLLHTEPQPVWRGRRCGRTEGARCGSRAVFRGAGRVSPSLSAAGWFTLWRVIQLNSPAPPNWVP